MNTPSRENALKGYLISVIGAAVWAGTAPGISYLQRAHVPSLTIAFWRDLIIAIALFAGIALIRPAALRMDGVTFKRMAIAGAISVGVYHALWVYSVLYNGPAMAVVLVYTYNAFVTLGARLFFKEPIRPLQALALVVSFLGLILAVRAYDPETLRLGAVGTLIGLASALAQAVYVFFNQRFIKTHAPLVTLAWLMGFGALALFVICLIVAPGDLTAVGDAGVAGLLVFIALGPTLGGYGLFNLSLRYIPGKISGLISVLEVPVAALISFVLLNDRLEPIQLVGMVLILISTVLPNLDAFRGAAGLRRAQGEEAA